MHRAWWAGHDLSLLSKVDSSRLRSAVLLVMLFDSKGTRMFEKETLLPR